MKAIPLALLAIFLLIALGACSLTTFDGSRTGNDRQLIMEYKVLNQTDSQLLELLEGDRVDFTVVSESGEVDILLQKEGSDPIYQGADVPTGSFQVEVAETGSYLLSVTGKQAKGSVKIMKITDN